MRKVLLMIAMGFVVTSCRNSSKPSQRDSAPEKQFFPLASYVTDQLKTIDSLKLPVMKITTINNKSDSVASTVQELKDSAQQLLQPDVTASPLKEQYTETSFADQSIPSITLSYAPRDKTLAVRRLDIILKPDPVLSDKVQNIYLEKSEDVKGTTIRKKMLWRADKNFQIISDRGSSVSIVKFEWDALE